MRKILHYICITWHKAEALKCKKHNTWGTDTIVNLLHKQNSFICLFSKSTDSEQLDLGPSIFFRLNSKNLIFFAKLEFKKIKLENSKLLN